MRDRCLHLAVWLVSRLVPERERAPFVGDLMEEYALHAKATSTSAAGRWCLQQICASVPSLLWLRIVRGTWLSTLGVALLAYIAVAAVEVSVNWALAKWGTAAYSPTGMLMTFPMVVLIGYFAAGLRRGAATVLGGMMLLAVTVMTVTAEESVPTWYRIAYFVVGPAATFAGSTLRTFRRRRC
jgi:hypothetical protein